MDAFLHFYSNQTMDFPSRVTFEDVKIWSYLELRCKVKYVYIFNEAQMFSDISCHSLNRVPEPGQTKPFQCCCSASVGNIYTQHSPCQSRSDCFPHPFSPQTHRTSHGKRHPNSHNICFHYIKLLWWKIFPMVPSMSNHGRLPIKQTTLKQSSSSSPFSPSQMLP